MRSTKIFMVLVLGMMVWLVGFTEAAPMSTAWTYQGRLMDANEPVDGLYDLQFKLFNDPCTGAQQGSIIEVNDLGVIDGYFTVELDFGSDVFDGDACWLEILVRPGNSIDVGDYVTLSPRQEVTPTPYALQTRGIFVDDTGNVGIGTTNPLLKLHVADSGMASLLVHETTNNVAGQLMADTGYVSLHSAFSHPLRFKINDITRLFIDTDGKVGIGTMSPLDDLHVYDSAEHAYVRAESERGYAFFIADGNYNSGLTLKENGTTKANVYWDTANDSLTLYESGGGSVVLKGGNFGIGTVTPHQKLTVITSESDSQAIFGEATGDDGTGIHGQGEDRGIYGLGWGSTGRGVYGLATDPSGVNYGVYGETWSSNGYAGYFQGRVRVTGNLSKGGGSFKIDHPLDPENKYLQHSFVESPDMMNVYNGNVVLDKNGEAVVKLPEYFEALNQDFRYQLTCIGGFAPVYVAEEISENQFKIGGGKRGMKVSWQVTGIRHDAYAEANRIAVEEDKAVEARGYYLHPEVYGYGKEKSIDAVRNSLVSEIRKVAINTD